MEAEKNTSKNKLKIDIDKLRMMCYIQIIHTNTLAGAPWQANVGDRDD